ncbi:MULTISPECIES: glycosyltransferase family 4 protein [unclassified Ruegeria]|uniref:glycosyltransferase family 4 protein n=1 Tax=unclassified Ruegeria TaxID=2625375 RepID=UPI001487A35C|nr:MULTISPECIES: glycosyltransferase family 4 protein [unclassified Ruegeria]
MPTKALNIPYGTKNPYQNMMYSACGPAFSLAAMNPIDFSVFAEPEFQAEHGIIHIQWDDRLFPVSSETGNNPNFAKAVDGLNQFKENGGKIIWTIHNRAAHATPEGSEAFHAMRRKLSELVHLIHVHTAHARAHMITNYATPPEKIRVIPHPSYLGVYESAATTLARPLSNRDQTRFLTFGTMRGNRELDKLHVAAAKLTHRGYDFHLSVVGRVFRSGRRMARRLAAIPNVQVIDRRVEDDEIPQLFSQAHAYVLPSTQTFTSGTAMLAQTYGLPLIAPDIEPHQQTIPDDCRDLLYPAQNDRGLIRMMRRVMQMSDLELNQKRKICFDFAQMRKPVHMSELLTTALEDLQNV